MRINFVREAHGWWDSESDRAIFDENSTTQTQAFTTHREAFERYLIQRRNRIESGFRYTFTWYPITGAQAVGWQSDPLVEQCGQVA
jgi:hypothetical protein